MGGITCHHPCLFALQAVRCVGCDRLPEVTQEGLVEHAFSSTDNDGPRFATKTFV